jgi:hypothetical protein
VGNFNVVKLQNQRAKTAKKSLYFVVKKYTLYNLLI